MPSGFLEFLFPQRAIAQRKMGQYKIRIEIHRSFQRGLRFFHHSLLLEDNGVEVMKSGIELVGVQPLLRPRTGLDELATIGTNPGE